MNVSQTLSSCRSKLTALEAMIPAPAHQKRVAEIDAKQGEPAFWNDQKGASLLLKERKKLAELLTSLSSFQEQVAFYEELQSVSLNDLEGEGTSLFILHAKIADIEFNLMMSDDVDDSPAIVSISAGAGGAEACQWVSMLLRMYLRWAAAHGFSTEILDLKPSEEHGSICIDNVSFQVSGDYAYGFLKGENGIHRLIRNSPFNAGNARQTSFAAVQVSPDIEDSIDINIEEKDIEITAQTAGGPGGQHSNKVSSAVRLKHIPSDINIFVRTERDQHANRRTAMKMLKAKLYDLELKKRQEVANKLVATQSSVSFGNQLRTYTLNPYQLVKDHRTDFEIRNFDGVLDGDLHGFLLAYLQTKHK